MTMHAIIYDRASTHMQEDNYSRVNAHDVGIRIAEQNGYTWEYVKEIGSGTTLTGRPKMMHILDRIAAGEVQRVIVQELDRLARPVERAVYETIRTIFIDYGVIVHTHNGRFDFSDDDNDFVADINMAVSKKESLRIKKRMRRGMVVRAEAGLFMGGPAPLGYDVAHTLKNGKRVSDLVINYKEAKLVQIIFDALEDAGGNIGQSAIVLNDAGYSGKKGKRFTPSSMRRIANNKTYIGIMESKLTDKIVHRPDLQILSVRQFERVQAMVESRKRGSPGAKGEYPFTGFVVCGNCGGAMAGANYKTGLRYTCITRRTYGKAACAHGKTYRHSSLLLATAEFIAEVIEDSGIMERILNDAANEYGKTISEEALEAAIDGELKVIQESRKRLIDAIAGGILTANDAAQKMNSLRDSEQRLIVERANISQKAAIRDQYLDAMELLRDTDIAETLIDIAQEKPLTFRHMLGLVFEPNSLKVKKSRRIYTIENYQFTEMFSELLQELSLNSIFHKQSQ